MVELLSDEAEVRAFGALLLALVLSFSPFSRAGDPAESEVAPSDVRDLLAAVKDAKAPDPSPNADEAPVPGVVAAGDLSSAGLGVLACAELGPHRLVGLLLREFCCSVLFVDSDNLLLPQCTG